MSAKPPVFTVPRDIIGNHALGWLAQLASGEYQLYREAEKANERALELAIKARPERRHYERAE